MSAGRTILVVDDDELSRAGAYRVYRDTAELYRSLDELGVVP